MVGRGDGGVGTRLVKTGADELYVMGCERESERLRVEKGELDDGKGIRMGRCESCFANERVVTEGREGAKGTQYERFGGGVLSHGNGCGAGR